MTIIHPAKAANGTSGLTPTNGSNGTDAIFTQNGKIGADALSVQATGGDGGDGGNGGVAPGANGGKGGNASITLNGNIFNAPATTSLVVSLTATGGDGGLAGTGTPAGSAGAGGNGTVTVNGNIIQPNKVMTNIELDAIAVGGNGSKKGNASATLNGNIVQPSKGATSVTLEASATAGTASPLDNVSHDTDLNFGTKTATVNGNIVQGNINTVWISADAYPSNGTANINGNIVQVGSNTVTGTTVTLEASANHISITNNKITLGKQEFDLTVNEYSPYDTTINTNTFTGSGLNTFVFTDNALPGPHFDTVTVDLANNLFVFNGQNNTLTGFNSASVLGTGDPATLIGNDNANTLTGGDGVETFVGGKGNDTLDGGNGANDTAVYSGLHTDYTYSFIHTGNLAGTVTDNVANRDGSDTLKNIEYVQFSDGTYNTVTNVFTPTVPTNTAPVLDPLKSPVLATEMEDAGAPSGAVGTLVSDLVDLNPPLGGLDNVTDADAGAVTGIALTGTDTANGSWFYSIDNGATWTAVGAVSDASARLLAADANTRLYFQPGTNYNGTDSPAITFRAWDQTSGGNGGTANASVNGGTTAFSAATDTADITITAVNDAPVATITPPSYAATEQVALNLKNNGLAISDVDAGAGSVTATLSVIEGTLNVTTGTSGAGVSGTGTNSVTLTGTVAQINALLNTNGTSTVSYIDNTDTPSASTTLTLSVNDNGNTGLGGPLMGSDTATINITAVNDAPVLDAGASPALVSEMQNAGAPGVGSGTLVSDLVDLNPPLGGLDNVTDPDGPSLGIALTATDTANGIWLYSTNGGTSWTAVGVVSDASALLLAADANTRLYFQPTPGYAGADPSAITFRAWDQSSGSNGGTADTTLNGGATAFSTTTDVASLTVTPTNNAPVLDNSKTPVLATEGENAGAPSGMVGTLVSSLVNLNPPLGGLDNVTDIDPTPVTGIALTATDTANGSWFYSTDNGATWNAVGPVSDSSALLLAADPNTRIYFQPTTDYSGTDSPAITFRAWDQSSGSNGGTADTTLNGGNTAFSTATDTADITIDPVRIGNTYYATINQALTAAVNGDTIYVSPGEYDESLLITKEVTIVGDGPAGSVVIRGTFDTDNGIPIGTDVATWLKTAGGYVGDTGVTVNADNVSLNNLTVENFKYDIGTQNNAESSPSTDNSVTNLSLTDVTMKDAVTGFQKDDGTTLTGLNIQGGSISDTEFGIYLANDFYVADGPFSHPHDAINTTINGVDFSNILWKGIYAETLQGDTAIDNVTMNDVGNFGGTPVNGPNLQKNGNGIDLNLKFHTYVGNLEISGFDLTNTGNSPNGGQTGAIVVEGRDDPGNGSYDPLFGGHAADVSGLTTTISNGTIDTAPSGIRVGELGKADAAHNVTGPAVLIDGVVITNTPNGEVENHSNSLMTVIGTDDPNTYTSDQAPGATGPIYFQGKGGNDMLTGGLGNDYLQGGTGDDTLDGGTGGEDTADYSDGTADGLVVNLMTGTSSGGGLGNDTLFNIRDVTGSAYNDYLIGDDGDNLLNGGDGNDILFGHGGNNTLSGGASGTDVAYYAGREGDYSVFGTSLVSGGLEGVNDLLASVARLKFLAPSHVSDTNNDGVGELVFQDASGNIAVNGTTLTTTIPATSRVVGTGQFNPDDVATLGTARDSSILVQASDGTLSVIYDINGAASSGPVPFSGAALNAGNYGSDWKAISAGDFNGDASWDVLLQNQSTHAVEIFIVKPNAGDPIGMVDSVVAVPTPGMTPNAIAAGDFNGDGKADILWQNSATKAIEITLMDGGNVINTPMVQATSGLTAIGSGDFNNDGFSEVLFKNVSNQAVIWFMYGDIHTGTKTVAKPGAAFTVAGAEDVDGNGYSDILWTDPSGNTAATTFQSPSSLASTTVLNPNLGLTPAGVGFHLVASTGGG